MPRMLNLPSKRVAALAAAALVVAGGGGAAVAASSGAGTPSDFLDSVAKHLGVSRQKLDDATKAAAVDQVDAQLAAGQITKAQADELKKRIAAGDVPRLAGGLGLRRGGLAGGLGGLFKAGVGDSLTAAAKYLGLSESDLRTKLGNGQSLADVAKAQGKDVAGLKSAIVDAAKADLDKAVADKKLTQSQADAILSGLNARIDDLVNGQLRGHGRPGGLGGPGGPGGPRGPGKPFMGDKLAAEAKYLGLSESDLRTKLGNGQSLADAAKAQGKDLAGLESAIVDATKADLDKAVADKKLTQSQADAILSGLKAHVDQLVNAKPGERSGFRARGRGGPGWFGP
jgi:hypothetical protein